MKPLLFLAGASLLVPALPCAATTVPRPDFVELLELKNAESGAAADTDDSLIERFLLADPASPYSDLKFAPNSLVEEAWHDELKAAGITMEEGFRQLAHRLGMTKARPYTDVVLRPELSSYDPFVAAQVVKADVDVDIFRQAIEHFQFHRSAIAANFAVAAQLLRERMSEVDPSRYEAAYILPDVLERFMALGPDDQMAEFDAEYLEFILSAETSAFHAYRKPGKQDSVLPPQFRVARLAAAYHDRTGYYGTSPCLPSAQFRPGLAGTGEEGDTRALCFVDATDRAVHAWYLQQYRNQAEGIKRYPDKVVYDSALRRLLRPIAIISEAVGIVSFIRFSTGMRLLAKGKGSSASTERLRSTINKKMCRK